MYSSTYGDRYSAQWKALRALNVLDRLALGPTLLTPKNRSLNSNKSLKEYQVLATKKNFVIQTHVADNDLDRFEF